MQPIVHVAVGYLCYAAVVRWRADEQPRDEPVLAVLVGAAMADLIDKPLAALGVVDVGRTVGHSLLFAVPLVIVVWALTAQSGRRDLGFAFGLGYASHLATDVPWHLLSSDFDELGFLLWPLTEMPAYTGVKPLGTVGTVEITTLWLEAVIFAAGLIIWWRDGRPGLETLRRVFSI